MLISNPFIDKTALLIDFDGTLVDSEGVLYTAFEKLMEQCSRKTSPEEFELLKGTPVDMVPRTLIDSFNLPLDEAQLLSNYKSFLQSHYLPSLRLYPQASLFLELSSTNFTCILVTSASSKIVFPFLKKSGLEKHFANIICAEDVVSHKPHPEPYLKALALHNIDKNKALVLEDSLPGLESGYAAGIETLFMNHKKSSNPSFKSFSTYTASHFDQLIDWMEQLC